MSDPKQTHDPKAEGHKGNIVLATKQQKVAKLRDLIVKSKPSLLAVARKGVDAERLVKLAHLALTRTPDLAECTQGSIILALGKCAELGLEPDSALPTRRMWLTPRWNNKIHAKECTYIMDYRAQLQLARDTGLVQSIVAEAVKKNDEFEVVYDVDGTSIAKFRFAPKPFTDRGPVVGYFACARLKTGEVQLVTMSVEDAQKHRDRFAPKTRDDKLVGPWMSDFDAMATKTCLRKLFNLLPAGHSPEAQKFQEEVAKEEVIEYGEPVEGAPAETPEEVEKLDVQGSPPGAEAIAKAKALTDAVKVAENIALQDQVEAEVKQYVPPTESPEQRIEKAKQDAQARMSKLAKESTPAKTAEQRVKDLFPDAKPVKKED